jgi:hypothetical protein
VRRLDDSGGHPAVGTLLGEAAWTESSSPEELADVLRSALRDEYADTSDAEMGDALENVLDSLSAAEAFNFGSALSQIGKSASKLAADPAFAQIVRTAAPIAGGALGTVIGGPVGMALGSQLGNLAASALPAPPAPPAPRPVPAAAPAPPAPVSAPAPPVPVPAPSAPAAPPPAPPALPAAAPVAAEPVPGPVAIAPPEVPPAARARAPSVAGGSAAAAQGLVLSQQPEILRSLLAAALGQQGRQQVSGVPVAQLLTLFSQVIGQAAADADELMYLEQQPDAAESAVEDVSPGSVRSLYADLLGADNLEFSEAAGWEGLDQWP